MRVPNLIRFLKSLIAVCIETIHHKSIFVPRSIADYRMRTCKACPKYDKRTRQCNVCTCYLPLKTRFRSEECPERKWRRWPFGWLDN